MFQRFIILLFLVFQFYFSSIFVPFSKHATKCSIFNCVLSLINAVSKPSLECFINLRAFIMHRPTSTSHQNSFNANSINNQTISQPCRRQEAFECIYYSELNCFHACYACDGGRESWLQFVLRQYPSHISHVINGNSSSSFLKQLSFFLRFVARIAAKERNYLCGRQVENQTVSCLDSFNNEINKMS